MPTLRWTSANPPAPDAEAFVMASRLEVRGLSDVPRFFVKTLAAWKQVKGAPGAYSASLLAEPFKGVFWTLSAWQDKDALYKYARTEPHKSVMTGLRPSMKHSAFTFWQTPAAGFALDWTDAKRRLAETAQDHA